MHQNTQIKDKYQETDEKISMLIIYVFKNTLNK